LSYIGVRPCMIQNLPLPVKNQHSRNRSKSHCVHAPLTLARYGSYPSPPHAALCRLIKSSLPGWSFVVSADVVPSHGRSPYSMLRGSVQSHHSLCPSAKLSVVPL